MTSATFLLMAANPFWYRGSQHAPGREIALVGECEDLYAVAQADLVRSSQSSALADGLDAGLEPIEDFPGSLVSGRYHSSRHSIKRLVKMVVGF
jgi:hypothetical protein